MTTIWKSEEGNMLLIGGILMACFMVGVAMTYFGSQQSSDNGFAVKQVDASSAPLPKAPESPSPFSTAEPKLPPFPDLTKAESLPQQQFKDPDFPFSFYVPNYFEFSKADIEQRKKEVLAQDPTVRWNRLAEYRVGVPFDNTLYDHQDCTHMVRLFMVKYTNQDNQNLSDFIKSERATYPGGGITATYDTYRQSLSQVNYPRPNSYLFAGIMSEDRVKEIFFEYGSSFYSIHMGGGCNTGEGYSSAADAFFTNLMQNMKFE